MLFFPELISRMSTIFKNLLVLASGPSLLPPLLAVLSSGGRSYLRERSPASQHPQWHCTLQKVNKLEHTCVYELIMANPCDEQDLNLLYASTTITVPNGLKTLFLGCAMDQ